MKRLFLLLLLVFIVACAPFGERPDRDTQQPETPEEPETLEPEEPPETQPPDETQPEIPDVPELTLTYAFTQDTTTTVTFRENPGLNELVMVSETTGTADQAQERFAEQTELVTTFLGQESRQAITYYREAELAYVQRQSGNWRVAEHQRDLYLAIEQYATDADGTNTNVQLGDEELINYVFIQEARQILGLSDLEKATIESQEVAVTRTNGNVVSVTISAFVTYEDEVDTLEMVIEHETTFSGHDATPTPDRPVGLP